ncbi:MAG TPA: ABC transporter ATP-binding protein [Candidatus Limnocylindrales bacterium]|nr:ABC transporter ATP-binding protein [Candidatus Limnocylindrales bacterium]
MLIARARYLELFLRYVGAEWPRALALTALLLCSIALQLLNPQLLRRFIDSALAGAEVSSLAATAILFMAIALTNQVVSASAQYVGEDLGWAATNALRADLLLHALTLDVGFHKARTPGELIERIDGDVTALANFFSRFVVNVLANFVLLIGVVVVVARESLLAGAAFTVFAVVALLVLTSLRAIAVREWGRVREVLAQMYGFLGEHLAGTEDIRSNTAEAHVMNGLVRHHRAWYAARQSATVRGTVVWTATIAIFAVGYGVAFAVGGYLWAAGTITIGTVYLLFHYIELLRHPIEQLRRELEEIQRAVASIGRIDELLRTTSVLPEGGGASIASGAVDVELSDVSFGYESDLVLRDVTLRVPAGRTLGVLGRTGSGKTTLARLLLRFYDPTSGAVRLGGVDLRDARIDDVRRSATLVSQDVQLFHASVRDNVTFFDSTVDDARILAVLDRIGLGPWLRRLLPSGADRTALDAELTAGSLSAGEAQLLAFARVFLRDPGLVILDEASSRLDPATERHIEDAIDELLVGRTTVVIAHRLATVERCDEIVILDAGRVLEHGAREALARDTSSRFHHLLRAGLEEVLA